MVRISVYRQRLCSFEGTLLVTGMKDDYLGTVCSGVTWVDGYLDVYILIREVSCIIEIIYPQS